MTDDVCRICKQRDADLEAGIFDAEGGGPIIGVCETCRAAACAARCCICGARVDESADALLFDDGSAEDEDRNGAEICDECRQQIVFPNTPDKGGIQ